MDPLGLALENFNALGMWRDTDGRERINSTGRLISGEKFKDIRELKEILKQNKSRDFYPCVTEKLMTYALGRGVEYSDTYTVDQIVDSLEATTAGFRRCSKASSIHPSFSGSESRPRNPSQPISKAIQVDHSVYIDNIAIRKAWRI